MHVIMYWSEYIAHIIIKLVVMNCNYITMGDYSKISVLEQNETKLSLM